MWACAPTRTNTSYTKENTRTAWVIRSRHTHTNKQTNTGHRVLLTCIPPTKSKGQPQKKNKKFRTQPTTLPQNKEAPTSLPFFQTFGGYRICFWSSALNMLAGLLDEVSWASHLLTSCPLLAACGLVKQIAVLSFAPRHHYSIDKHFYKPATSALSNSNGNGNATTAKDNKIWRQIGWKTHLLVGVVAVWTSPAQEMSQCTACWAPLWEGVHHQHSQSIHWSFPIL